MDNLVNILLAIAVMSLCYVGIKNSEHINELRQEIKTLKETKGLTSNPKLITPQPNEPIEIGKVGNRTFFLAKIDDKECISVIGLNMGSYVIGCNEQGK